MKLLPRMFSAWVAGSKVGFGNFGAMLDFEEVEDTQIPRVNLELLPIPVKKQCHVNKSDQRNCTLAVDKDCCEVTGLRCGKSDSDGVSSSAN